MDAQVLSNSSSSSARRQTRLVIVRANGPLFYSVAVASLLEAIMPPSMEPMLHHFRADHAFCEWMRAEWLPGKVARAQALREYVENTWPEFDWSMAHEQHRARIEQNGGAAPQRASAAHEALARCVGAAQSARFYRCLARWADDMQLREMARGMAQVEAQSFAHFRAAFERRARIERVSFASAWCTALGCVRSTRDTSVRLAFEALVGLWGPNAPFPAMDYAEFIQRMKSVVQRYAELGLPERILFRPWKTLPPVRVAQVTRPVAKGFRPVLAQAA